jgi:DNA invertase Pin-like site-specific DNA recombinase
LIKERTRAGVKAAQKRGVKLGRKPKLTPDRLAHARKLIEQGMSPTDAAKIIGIGRTTLNPSYSLHSWDSQTGMVQLPGIA